MSWKSLVTASLLCVVASPVFAAPSLSITSGGLDATTGEWIWNVSVTPTATGTPLAVELGLTANGALKSVANATPATWDYANPGTQIFNWETKYGTPLFPEGIEANCTGCTVTNGATQGGNKITTVNGTLNQIFAALGSIDLTSGAATQVLQVKTAGPNLNALTSSLTLSGAYTGSARIAEMNGATASNFKGFTGVASRTAKAGDTDLSGTVNIGDLNVVLANFNSTGGWSKGNFDSDLNNAINIGDLNVVLANFNGTGGSNSPLNVTGIAGGAGLGAGSAVPEPASVALIGLALLGGLGLVGRKR